MRTLLFLGMGHLMACGEEEEREEEEEEEGEEGWLGWAGLVGRALGWVAGVGLGAGKHRFWQGGVDFVQKITE